MKLLTEHCEEIEYLVEEKNGTKNRYIKGIFMQSEKQNRNGRIYSKDVLMSAVDRYVNEQVKTGRSVGELNHPPTPQINLDKVSHLITELTWEGNNVIGKAKVLDTPMGKIVNGLIDGGVYLGVSSRGMGSLKEKNGKKYVGEDFILSTVDIVQDPSAQEAFVEGIMEGVEWIVTEDGRFEQQVEETKKTIHRTPSIDLAEQQIKEFNKLMNALKG
jgi:hypothetical protein